MPPMSSPPTSHPPVCTPARTSMPNVCTASRPIVRVQRLWGRSHRVAVLSHRANERCLKAINEFGEVRRRGLVGDGRHPWFRQWHHSEGNP